MNEPVARVCKKCRETQANARAKEVDRCPSCGGCYGTHQSICGLKPKIEPDPCPNCGGKTGHFSPCTGEIKPLPVCIECGGIGFHHSSCSEATVTPVKLEKEDLKCASRIEDDRPIVGLQSFLFRDGKDVCKVCGGFSIHVGNCQSEEANLERQRINQHRRVM